MFITIRYGNDSKEIFNPDCRMVNLIDEIRKKCKIEKNQIVDLTDETVKNKFVRTVEHAPTHFHSVTENTRMLVRICSAKPHDKGTQYLVPLTTYILVEKRTINKQSKVCSKKETLSKDLYFPLLVGVNKLLPDYHFHKTLAEKAALMKKLKAAKNAIQSEEQKDEGKANYQRKSVTLSSARKSIVSYKNTTRRFTTFARRSTMM